MNVPNAPKSGVSPSRPPIRDWFGVVRLAEKIDASLEQHFWRWASAFVLLFLAASIARDLRTALWFDELFTLHLAKLASARAIIGFNDASPPLYPIIVHWLLPIVGNEALAVRLPATLGYCAMLSQNLGVLPSPIARRLCLRGIPAHLRARLVFRDRRPALWRSCSAARPRPSCVGKWRPMVTGEV